MYIKKNKLRASIWVLSYQKKTNEFQRSKIDYVDKYVLLCMYNKKNIVAI